MSIAANRQKKYLSFPLFLVILLVLGFGAWSLTQRYAATPIGINEVSTTGSVSLSLSPATTDLNLNSETTISLNVDSGTDRLSVVKFEINYDPAKIAVSNTTLGTWITKELTAITVSNGKIAGEIGAQPDSTTNGGIELQRTGSGTILTFKAKGLASGNQTLTINTTNSDAWTITDTTANAVNMLKSVSGTTLNVIDPRPKTDLIQSTNSSGVVINIIDRYDYVELLRQYGKTPAGSADLTGEGAVDRADYTIFMADYGKTW